MATLLADAIPPALARPMIQLGVRVGRPARVRAGNLMVSNVPGPDFPLYFAGMEMHAVYPLGPVVDGVALNITVQSYRESLFVGINACATAVPDLPGSGRAMVGSSSLLCRMAVGAGQRRVGPGRPRRRSARSSPDSGRREPAPNRRRALGLSRVAECRPGCARVGAVQRSDLEAGPVAVAPWLLNKVLARGDGRGGSSRWRRTTGPTTRPRTPTGVRRRGRRSCSARRGFSTCTSPTGCTGAPTWCAGPRARRRRC